jgi:hypothetical protein
LAEDHRIVLLSIFSTLVAAVVVLIVTVAVSGGVTVALVKSYVLPLVISAFTLAVFWGVLFANSKGKLPFLGLQETKNEKPAPAAEKQA